MRRSLLSIVLVGAVVAPGLASAQQSPPATLTGRPWRGYATHSDYPTTSAKPVAAPMHRILFVNKNGGTYVPGADDSSTNTSSIVTQVSQVPPFHLSDTAWAQVMDCIRYDYERFSIEVTDVDPGDVAHIENVVGGYPADIGQPASVGGIAPYTPCGTVTERAVTYTFERVWGNVQDICDTIAQESAHAFALDHEFLCEDPMTYLFGCGPKTFQDVDAPCGEYDARLCRCGGNTQNSVQMLYDILGYADPIPPEVTITSPADGATVAPGFTVATAPTDNGRVARVELWVDGVYQEVFVAADPWSLIAPAEIPFGSHTVEVHAIDGGLNIATASITVDIEPECTTDDQCGPTEDCANGACGPGLGQPCEQHTDCASLTCSRNPDNIRVCSTACGGDGSCPTGFACEVSTNLCFVEPPSEGGGCTTTTTTSGLGTALLLALALLGVTLRRRTR